jgi:hypothetical protein
MAVDVSLDSGYVKYVETTEELVSPGIHTMCIGAALTVADVLHLAFGLAFMLDTNGAASRAGVGCHCAEWM